jgi:site-specific DNA-cytosine methylase
MPQLKVLIGCEESQEVCKAFRELGHEAYSCDIIECSGGYPEWHLQMDVFEAIKMREWDLMIAFPPCTDLAVSGARWFKDKQESGQQRGSIEFFLKLTETNIRHWCIENPIGIMSTWYRKPDQIIQPWMFGHGETKATCLWLFNLPKLQPTNIVDGRENRIWKMPPLKDRAKLRSKTYSGIAKAMADQFSKYILNELHLIN